MEIQLFIRKKHLNLLRTFEKPKRISPQILNLKVCKYRKNNSKCQFSRNFLFLVPIYKHLYISYVCMDRTNSWCYFLINFAFFRFGWKTWIFSRDEKQFEVRRTCWTWTWTGTGAWTWTWNWTQTGAGTCWTCS